MKKNITVVGLAALALAVAGGCGKKVDDKDKDKNAGKVTAGQKTPDGPGAIKAGPGVDIEKKILRVGTLNDESGPAALIGKPFANGKRLLAKVANESGSGLLPDGWKMELVEKDHAYNSQKAVQEYNAIKNDVLFIGTSFGTPNTIPLRNHLERDNIIAFPASLSSEMAKHKQTPPVGPSYAIEAMRAMDWAVKDAGGADKVKAAIVWQKDDYGKDGIDGWKKAAAAAGVKVVAEEPISPLDKDFTAVVTKLKKSGANYVLLTVLPSATGPILGTAAKAGYKTKWIGGTAAWSDFFFAKLPPQLLGSFYWVTGLPYWGEKLPGMDKFVAAYEKHGKEFGAPDFYIMTSYIQGLVQLEAFRRAYEAKDLSRAGYAKALRSIKGFTAEGLFQDIDLTKFPYETGLETRVLKPDPAKKSWTVVGEFAVPSALNAAAAPAPVKATPKKTLPAIKLPAKKAGSN